MKVARGSVFGICALACLLPVVRGAAEEGPVVTVKQGKLKGHVLKTRQGRDIHAFQGIPYAKPPVGALRFALSEPAEDWSGVKEATEEGPECIQKDTFFDEGRLKGGEDCLYLNVYTPQVKPSSPFAVLVWMHGGGWFSGSSSSTIYGPGFLLDRDIVLVTFNYRLGPFGFLSTEDSVCPGNNGLKDQTFALKWVRDNIAQFGGDPGRVTIAGQSAGGGSTQYHMISPMSKGLFHGVITQSGSVLGQWAIAPKGEGASRAHKLATLFNCPTESSAQIIDCLRTKDAKKIIEAEPHFKEWNFYPIITYRPVVEGEGGEAFIPEEPIEMIRKSSAVADVPWMTGLTSAEGALNVASIMANETQLQELNEDFHRIVPLTLLYSDTSPAPHYVTESIMDFYFENKPITEDTRSALVDMYTDSYFLHPIDSSVRIVSKLNKAPVFYYYFDYKGPASYSVLFGDPDRDYGVSHCDELQFLFPHQKIFPNKKLSEDDYKMVDIVTLLWTNFVKHGNPTPAGCSLPKWDQVKKPEVEFLHIGPKTDVRMSASLLAARTDFWTKMPVANQPISPRDEL